MSSARPAAQRVRVLPIDAQRWADFEQLFSARGAPHYCWCSPYRFAHAERLSAAGKRAAMHELVVQGTPIGVLAYAGERVVGWCSVAPRESYVKLQRSRTMPRLSDLPTWTVLCLFVPRPERGQRLTSALLRGALRYARAQGAQLVEGFPHDTAGISSTHRGSSAAFAAAGFQEHGQRWIRRWARPAPPRSVG
ncbi:MAG: GNAT family N-acetyltransferase [Deltaproteobacteria bacterium]